jgi:S-formylglutathione hydrolase FrmB
VSAVPARRWSDRGRSKVPGLLLAALLVAGCAAGRYPLARREIGRSAAVPGGEPFTVYLPPSYRIDRSRRYPVLYFLHDAYGDDLSLYREGVAKVLADAMRAGRLPEMIIVAPEGRGTWFSNDYRGKRRVEDFIVDDLVPRIDQQYRTIPERGRRGICGISMGGYGAVKIALHHPRLFSTVSSLSGALVPMEWEDIKQFNLMARISIHRVFGDSAEVNTLTANDVWKLVESRSDWNRPFVEEFRAGTEDKYRLDRVAAQFGAYCNLHDIPTSVVLEPGGHDWSYWRSALPKMVAWHAASWGAI